MSRWQWLMQNAKLEIAEFNVDRLTHFHLENRRLPYYVMSYIQEGLAESIIEGVHYATPVGSLLLIPANVVHSHYMPEGAAPTTFLWWHFNITVEGVDIMRWIQYPRTLRLQSTEEFEKHFYEYVEIAARRQSLANIVYRKAKELELMALLLENIFSSHPNQSEDASDIPDAFFEIFKQIVDHPEQNRSLRDIAKQYFMNPTYVSNRFASLFGISPIKLRNNILFQRAQTALSGEHEVFIGDLARQFGFADNASFTRFFTLRAGCSPSEYREKTRGTPPADAGPDTARTRSGHRVRRGSK